MRELKLDGTEHHMGLQTELEQLRQESRSTAQDYWSVNWGPMTTTSRTSHTEVDGGGGGGGRPERKASFKEQREPLPPVPNHKPSPILGVQNGDANGDDGEDDGATTVAAAVEVHSVSRESDYHTREEALAAAAAAERKRSQAAAERKASQVAAAERKASAAAAAERKASQAAAAAERKASAAERKFSAAAAADRKKSSEVLSDKSVQEALSAMDKATEGETEVKNVFADGGKKEDESTIYVRLMGYSIKRPKSQVPTAAGAAQQ